MKHSLLIGAVVCATLTFLHAETGHEAWLRYVALHNTSRAKYKTLPASVIALGDSVVLRSAQRELVRGVHGMLGKTLRTAGNQPRESAIILGTLAEVHRLAPSIPLTELREDGFWIASTRIRGFDCLLITAPNDRGVLYGVFALLRKIALGEDIARIDEKQEPYAPVRWVNEWNNLDGTIERGYAGPSIFFENGSVRSDLTRVQEYGRLLASLGINGCAINNVNADARLITLEFLPEVARIANAFRPWGVRTAISIDFSSPKRTGGLDTFDPLDPRVAAWWKEKVDEIYRVVPDLGGFVLKADSEGRLGPSAYGRTHADAANVIARALKPHDGLLFYRGFVYDHHMDWRNLKNDRARAAYDNFHPLDRKFDDNVIIQIKHGPIDFQVREPASPLFGALRNTNQAVELQITQEYTGQQRHLCFLVPMWKEVLDFDMHADRDSTPVRDLVAGKTFHRPTSGCVGVSNVGMDANWLGHPLAMANLYGYGRLAWDPLLSSNTVAAEWTRLTFGSDPAVVTTITAMLLSSWHTYENYTGPLGAQTLTDILGSHYGPGVESSERNGWGQWHRADEKGVGMDRTVSMGTGYVGQYSPAVQKLYETLEATPDELVLFFHHVPYTHVLRSGKTVIQHIYDSHYDGAQQAGEYVREWRSLKGRIDEERYAAVLTRLEYQAGHAIVWRDAVCDWFHRMSGIPDAKGRVGHYADRIEAENMTLQGYVAIDITPWENASGGKGVECRSAQGCSATFKFERPAGRYDIDVQYFDQNNGQSKFRLLVGDRLVDQWLASDYLPSNKPGGDTSTRHRTKGVVLRSGGHIRIEGIPDSDEHAALDYIELHAARQ